MQIRCTNCGRAVTVAATGALPERCPHCQQAPVPERLGKWRIERLLAAGGMGEVYLARHGELGSRVAIKRLPPMPHGDGAAMRLRFAREALLTAAIDHPGVVRVLDFEADGDDAFLVLEYLDGRSLRSLLQGGPLPLARAVELVLGVADVLAAAHRQGVVHRDIKPENVLVARDGSARVLDFGIAKALQDEAPITRTGEILGTPEYMAPEQLLEAADAIDARTDVHALAILLYELLTGRSPFHGQNLFSVLKLVESLVPPPPSSLRQQVPAAVDAVVMRGLRKVAAERFADAGDFAAALRAALPAAAALAATRTQRAWPWLLAVAAGFCLYLLLPKPHQPPASTDIVAADPRPTLRALLEQPAADLQALRSPRLALLGATDVEALALRGRAAFCLGDFTAALQDLDAAVRAGDGAAAEPAAAAWLCANTLLPTAVGAAEWLLAIDRTRRDRLFGFGADGARALPDTPLAKAMTLLASGDAAAALMALRPVGAAQLSEPAATIALLAACRACADRAVLRGLLAELRPQHPGPGFLLLQAGLGDRAALLAALRTQRDQGDITSPDRWLRELGIAFVETAAGEPRLERMRAAAEMAWLLGAGERATLWFLGLRLHLAAHPGFALPAAEAERLLRLLGGGDAMDQPARAAALALLHVANHQPQFVGADLGELPAAPDVALAAFRSWQLADADRSPSAGRLWQAYAQLLVGNRDAGVAALLQLTSASPGIGDCAHLLLAVFAPAGVAPEHWPAALRSADAGMLDLLRPLPGEKLPLDLAEQLPAAVQAGVTPEQLLPALRACARLGNDLAPLLQLPALLPLSQAPLHTAYVREVQGGIERR